MALHVLNFLLAIFGMLRFEIGMVSFRIWFFRAASGKPVDFQDAWNFVLRNSWFFKGRTFFGNRFQSNWKQFAVYYLARIFRKKGWSFQLDIGVEGKDVLGEFITADRPLIILAPHTRLSDFVDGLVASKGTPFYVLASSANASKSGQFWGFEGKQKVIVTSQYSLLEARSVLRQGFTIVANPDFTERQPRSLYQNRFVSEGLFRLAKSTGSSLLFSDTKLTEECKVVCHFEEPQVNISTSEPHEVVADFIRFCIENEPLNAGLQPEPHPKNYPRIRLYDFYVPRYFTRNKNQPGQS